VYEEELKLRLTPIDIPLTVNKKYNDTTSLRRRSPSGAQSPSLIDAATSTNAL
jgi:hypothetical protein